MGRAVRARYSDDATKHEESLSITPMGYGTSPSLSAEIAVPLPAAPHCPWEIQGRCVTATDPVAYAGEARRDQAAGTVVLAATVNTDGSVTGARVVELDVAPRNAGRLLARSAIENLKALQLDAAGHSEAIRIRYSFAIDPALARGGAPEVQWIAPDQIRVRAGPPE